MSDIAIKAENIGKIFRIYDRPSDRLKEAFSIKRRKYHTDFPALKNISFEVKKGEFLGIVGKNGAGKSTLLKILSRELTPTSGTVIIDGKVSLLQLGVGFDPELTGFENARFASKLLGYSDDEIEAMLEDIISFADIGEFIYHPVKTYSSGMYSRLSFAVGINIDPDILIADEVLAVGDMRFSQKCLRKMREFKDNGKTIILVTHDVQTVNVFCDTAMWIKDGEIFQLGEAKKVSTDFMNYMLYDKLPETYKKLNTIENKLETQLIIDKASHVGAHKINYENVKWEDLSKFPCVGDRDAEITRMAFLLKETMEKVLSIQGKECVILLLDITIKRYIENPQVGIRINTQRGLVSVHTNNDVCGKHISALAPGSRLIVQFSFKLPSLSNGYYSLSVGIQDKVNGRMLQLIEDGYEFRINRDDLKSTQCGYVIIEDESVDIYSLKNATLEMV